MITLTLYLSATVEDSLELFRARCVFGEAAFVGRSLAFLGESETFLVDSRVDDIKTNILKIHF